MSANALDLGVGNVDAGVKPESSAVRHWLQARSVRQPAAADHAPSWALCLGALSGPWDHKGSRVVVKWQWQWWDELSVSPPPWQSQVAVAVVKDPDGAGSLCAGCTGAQGLSPGTLCSQGQVMETDEVSSGLSTEARVHSQLLTLRTHLPPRALHGTCGRSGTCG